MWPNGRLAEKFGEYLSKFAILRNIQRHIQKPFGQTGHDRIGLLLIDRQWEILRNCVFSTSKSLRRHL